MNSPATRSRFSLFVLLLLSLALALAAFAGVLRRYGW